MKVEKYARAPFFVDAVQVTEENMEEVAKWCNGEIRTQESSAPDDMIKVQHYVKVRVQRPINDRQTMAYVGDWILYAGTGYKVYTPKAFKKSFKKCVTDLAKEVNSESQPVGEVELKETSPAVEFKTDYTGVRVKNSDLLPSFNNPKGI